jgi:hypothetical protein
MLKMRNLYRDEPILQGANMEEVIDRLLKQSQEQQKSILRYFSRCPPTICVEILQKKHTTFHALRQKHNDLDKGTLEYCALILSIKSHHDDELSLKDKSFTGMDIEEIRNISRKKANQFMRTIKKADPKREKLLGYWAVVRTLKLEQNFSFRQIGLYLMKYHKLSVAHSTIYQLWNELENETKHTGVSK